ncbi:MAG: YMGG-like glycine zipper-containing protein [Rhizobiaceae bacterium]
MRRLSVFAVALLLLSACNATQRGAGTGALIGGAIGAVATGHPRGALVGAAAGGLAGALIGRDSEDGKCRYRDRRGRVYIDDC